MIDLIEYGFIESAKSDRHTEYTGHDFIVTIYHYMFLTFEKVELAHHAFVVTSKQFTSRSRPIEELEEWLKEKNINKVIA